MPDRDETRDPLPDPPTATHAPGSGTPSFVPELHGTIGQTPDQLQHVAARIESPTIPGYEILGELGHGGMGVVYRAREVAFDRDVAIKLLHARYRADSPGTRRFLEEARITGQLQHPAIPPVHHIGALEDGRPFLVMKLIKGETLADLLEAEPANRGRFVPAFAQVCQALAYAHSRKVIHRDLKPANVMVGAFGEVLVMDWGLAKVLADEGRRASATDVIDAEDERTEIRTAREAGEATQAGSVLGTPAYMAPEQAAGEVEKIDERSDVFGLGAVLCAILTGKPPYSGPSTDAIRLKAIRGETTDAFTRLDGCGADPELVALCKRCLAAERATRPRDADEVAKAVSAHLAADEERARRAELDRVRAEEQRKRRRVQFVLVGAVLVALALAGFGAALASLWRAAENATEQLAGEKRQTEDARDTAVRLQERAETAQASETDLRKKLEVFEYGRTIQAAHQEWKDNNLVRAVAMLEGTAPHLRGWEWHYVHRLCHGSLLTLKGHAKVVFSASFSPDDLRIVTGSGDDTAKVWDAKTGAELLTLKGHASDVISASFSPDGSRIVTASHDQTAKVWDADTGAELFTLNGHTEGVYCASFSVNGAFIVTGSDDKTARVWDAKTGAKLVTLTGHAESVTSASFHVDGSRIVTASHDKTAKVWDAKTGAELLTFNGHTSDVFSASFSPDGSRVVTGSEDGTAKVWDAKTGAEVLTLKGHMSVVMSAAFSADGFRIVTGGGTGRADGRFRWYSGKPTMSWDTAVVWDAKTGAQLLTLKGYAASVCSASFSTDGSRIVTGGEDKTAKAWDAKTGAELLTLKGHTGWTGVHSASFSADGSLIVTGSHTTAKVWDAKTGAEVFTLSAPTERVSLASFSPDGLRIITSGRDQPAKVWDAKTGIELLTLKGHTGRIYAVSFNPHGSRVTTGNWDRTVKVWDAKTGAEVLSVSLEDFVGHVTAAAFSADGSRIVVGSRTDIFKGSPVAAGVWDAKTGAKRHTLKGHMSVVTSVSFSRDGSRIVTGGRDQTAKVWDAHSGAELVTLGGHLGSVESASFSPDGLRIVTGSGDATAKVWDARTGAELFTLKGHTGVVRSASFSADGSRIVTGSEDKTVKVWDARPLAHEFLPKEPPPPVTR